MSRFCPWCAELYDGWEVRHAKVCPGAGRVPGPARPRQSGGGYKLKLSKPRASGKAKP